jgi:ubiquinone/menaquinone biosynthesis C-methylase UbiE
VKKVDLLREVLKEDRVVRVVEDNLYSVTVNSNHAYQYDARASVYDAVVGCHLYNRVMWGSSVQSYANFARRAISSHPRGLLLEAGCGSLLFTAQAYAEISRPIIAFDQSLDMLRRAGARLAKLGGSVLEHIVLLQADLGDIPFRENSFETILTMNVLHHYADVTTVILSLRNLLTRSGDIYLTSLVKNHRLIGDQYLSLLHNMGWVVKPREKRELRTILEDSLKTSSSFWMEGNMAYATTAT